jgi:class 3 adenylate cyclase
MAVSSRRLVAIMFTDIAGYTDTMGKDEAKALLALESSREIVSSEVEAHGGTALDRIGDGTLSSFDSAVAAVDCARKIQE